MQVGLWILSCLMVWLLLALAFRTVVKHGGRKVVPINPQELIIYPARAASLARTPRGEQLQDARAFTLAERFLPLEGVFNFRDLGGYRTQEGGTVRWGKIYRSDEFSELSDADLEALAHLELRTIIDLRSPREIRGKENRLPPNSTYRQIRIYKREPITDYLGVTLFRRHLLAQALGANYIKLAETRAKTIGAALRLLADAQNLPIVYHCSAGKDRTGIVCALALSLLGVPDEVIIADYSLSNLGFEHYYTEFIAEGRLNGWGIPYEEFQAVFIVRPDWMRSLLAHLRENYGSIENYLLDRAGLQPQELERIRENLLA